MVGECPGGRGRISRDAGASDTLAVDVRGAREDGAVQIVLSGDPAAGVTATRVDDGLASAERVEDLVEFVRREDLARPRWVWSSASEWLPPLLRAGVRVERCHDLALVGAILASSQLVTTRPRAFEDPVERYREQRIAIETSRDPGRLELLTAAESAGAIIAAELRAAGLPWSATEHDRILTELLGPRPVGRERPAVLAALHEQIEAALDGAIVNPDSPQSLLAAMRAAGIPVRSTQRWELRGIDHPAIAPLSEYRSLSRLMTANGWAWLDTWVSDGRFRPEYVPGGVVTGRWASSGGGALQLPMQIRAAAVADPGWRLVVADAAQLEPRILAAMSGDAAMIEAGAGADFYAGLVEHGAAADRAQAKVAMLGAMYGATTGASGKLMPALARAYPRAISLVERAARDGEQGRPVSTWLGRSSPERATDWTPTQARAWGRFTRNFVVQGTAAEWALCWLGGIRGRLAAAFPGSWPEAVPHLVFFLHDEIVVHTPQEHAEEVAGIVEDAARDAGRLLFGASPATFPVSIATVRDYGAAKASVA